MSGFSGSPRVLKGGLVLLDPNTGALLRLIALQYNPDTLTRSLQIQSVAGEGQNRSEPLRLKGPPVETIKLDAELDATDQLEFPDQNADAVAVGLLPQLAALETIIYPSSQTILSNHSLAQQGTLEIAPMESALTLFVWSTSRIVPVRLTEFSITEEAFDTNLNPIRAKVSLGMRVLTIDDFAWTDRGTALYMVYQQQKEALARRAPTVGLATLGLAGVPSGGA
ncbi:MAG TPA: hypothetical protein VFE41_17855 [Acetobacteraceae bacterium]|jgi:hypothetical protein|nr:hypothetical protein [Acetobacteraceae bacterium]